MCSWVYRAVYSRSPFPSHLCGSSVLPARGDMGDDAGMALLAYIDAVHLDDALAWVEPGDSCHRAWRETDKRERRGVRGRAITSARNHAGASG